MTVWTHLRIYLHQCSSLLGEGWRRLPFLIVLFLLVSMLELLGIGLVAPFLVALVAPDAFVSLPLPEAVNALLASKSTGELLPWLGTGIALVFIARMIFFLTAQRAIVRFSFRQQLRLQQRLLHAYQHLPYEFHLQRNSASLIYSISQLTERFARDTLIPGLRLVSWGIVTVFILTLLTLRAPLAVAGVAVLLGSVMLLYDRLVRLRMLGLGQTVNHAYSELIMAIHHALAGLKEIRVLGREEYYHKIAERSMVEIIDATSNFEILKLFPRQLLETVVVLFMVILTMLTLSGASNGTEFLATLGMFGVAAVRLIPASNEMINSIHAMRFGRAGVSALYADLRELEQQDCQPMPAMASMSIAAFESLELRGVTFHYQGARVPAVRNINLRLHRGESLGLIGPSGAGKSTLVDVILGFLQPQEGTVFFNKRPLTECLADWLKHVAYLPQTVFLTDDSLRRNVALGVQDQEIDEDRLWHALRQARLEDLVAELPNGLDTLVGEQGVRLSGGQRQRVALARAFYHSREVLILDEATSALDTETEREIIEEIKRLRGIKTLIVIAHRLSTVEHCDRILRLDHGKIVCEGNYQEVVGI